MSGGTNIRQISLHYCRVMTRPICIQMPIGIHF